MGLRRREEGCETMEKRRALGSKPRALVRGTDLECSNRGSFVRHRARRPTLSHFLWGVSPEALPFVLQITD